MTDQDQLNEAGDIPQWCDSALERNRTGVNGTNYAFSFVCSTHVYVFNPLITPWAVESGEETGRQRGGEGETD